MEFKEWWEKAKSRMIDRPIEEVFKMVWYESRRKIGTCKWVGKRHNNYYITDCDNFVYVFNPKAKYCHFCGKKLKVV